MDRCKIYKISNNTKKSGENQKRKRKSNQNYRKEAAAKNSIWIDNNGNKIINSEKEIVTAEEKNDIWIEYTE